jgi:GAF domain-containing protein
MRHYAISSRGVGEVRVEATNWLAALGLALEKTRAIEALDRLACERLPNGTVIARDAGTGVGYVVAEVEAERPEPPAPDLRKQRIRSGIEAVQEAPTAEAACNEALALALQFVPGESGAVLVLDPAGLRFAAVSGPKAHKLVGERLPAGSGIAGVCAQTGVPMVLGDTGRDPRHLHNIDELTGYRTREIAAVPVILGDKVLGVLEVLNLPAGERFGRVYVDSLKAVADLLANRLAQL